MVLLLCLAIAWVILRTLARRKQIFLPNVAFSNLVHSRMPIWMASARRHFFSVPEDAQPSGLLALLFWFPMVALNLGLLSQVLEVVVPSDGAGRLVIWPFGSFAALALVAGCLVSLSQSVFATAFDLAKARSGRIVWGGLCLAAILFEVAMSWLRGKLLLDTGGDMMDLNSIGQVILHIGPYVTAVLGFLIPAAHALLGAVAYRRFVVPLLEYTVSLTKAAGLVLLTVVGWVVCGWYERRIAIVPAAAELLSVKAAAAEATRTELNGLVKNARELSRSLDDFSRLISGAPGEPPLAALEHEVSQVANQWRARDRDLERRVKSAPDLATLSLLTEKAEDAVADSSTELTRVGRSLKTSANCLDRLTSLASNSSKANDWIDRAKRLDTALGTCLSLAKSRLLALADWRGGLRAVLDGAEQKIIPAPQAGEIAALLGGGTADAPAQLNIVTERLVDASNIELDLSRAISEGTAEVAELRRAVASTRSPDNLSRPVLAGLNDQVQHLDERMVKAYESTLQFQERRGHLARQRRWYLLRRPLWLWIVLNPLALGHFDPEVWTESQVTGNLDDTVLDISGRALNPAVDPD